MLKRSGALLLTMLYVVTVFGFALNFHYCGKILASVKIDSPAKSCQSVTAEKMKCCKDKQIKVKVKDAHQSQSVSFLKALLTFEIPDRTFTCSFLSEQKVLPEQLSYRGPPFSSTGKTAVFIKNCNFRI